jgi:O-phosphoseryl-tRNA(Sec) kinase
MTQFLLVLCGLPASGKSALADAIQVEMDSGVEIVRTDDWRNDKYYTDWKPEREKPVRQAALEKTRSLVASGKSVIHDDTNYYASMRHELLDVAVENACAFAIVHVTTPLTTALKWNREREDSKIPDNVIKDIFEKFDNPGRRYLWDKAELEVDMETQELPEVIPEILEVLENLEPAIKPILASVTSNEFNELDAKTRLIVSEFLQEHPELRGSRKVSTIRRDVLHSAIERRTKLKEVNEILIDELNKLL